MHFTTNHMSLGCFEIEELSQLTQLAQMAYNRSFAQSGIEFKRVEDFGLGLQYVLFPTHTSLVAAFRGSINAKNIQLGFDMKLVKAKGLIGRVHQGFYKAFRKIAPQLIHDLQRSRHKDITLVGHSLGGALARITACYLYNMNIHSRVLTLGAPCLFDQDQDDWFEEKLGNSTLQLVQRKTDPITTIVPTFLGYSNKGTTLSVRSLGMPHRLTAYKTGLNRACKHVRDFYRFGGSVFDQVRASYAHGKAKIHGFQIVRLRAILVTKIAVASKYLKALIGKRNHKIASQGQKSTDSTDASGFMREHD